MQQNSVKAKRKKKTDEKQRRIVLIVRRVPDRTWLQCAWWRPTNSWHIDFFLKQLETTMAAWGICSQQGAPPGSSFGELLVEGHLDALDLVTQLDGRSQLQVHALLDGGQRQQQQRLAVDVLCAGRQTQGRWGGVKVAARGVMPLLYKTIHRND